jgi:hypothetical protein
MVRRQIDPIRKTKFSNLFAKLISRSVAKRVSVEHSWIESGSHEVELLEIHQPLFVDA